MHRHVRWAAFAALVIGASAFGCVGGSKSAPVNKEALKQYVLSVTPADIPNKLNTVFEGKAKLLGYRVTPADKKVKPGSQVTITMYWEALDKIDDGWNLFTHVVDGNSQRMLNLDNVGPIRQWADSRQALGPSQWEKGKIYVDEQTFTLPDKLDTPTVVFTTGIWKGDARLKVVSGDADRENRAIVVRFETPTPPKSDPSKEIKSLRVDKMTAADKIVIDGKLDEATWKRAATTGPFVDVGTGKPNPGFPAQGSARITWDDKYLYVGFEVISDDIVGGFPKGAKDPHLWEKDTVEIMIDPDGDGDNKDYYEIQINPQNLVFDTQYDMYNEPKDDAKGMFGHMDWSSKVESKVVVQGEIDKPGEGKGYVVEARIPWTSFSKANQVPPKPGDSWRMNFYAMKNNSGVAWSPILGQGNFHKASRFGRITWAIRGEEVPTNQQVDEAPAASASAAIPAGAVLKTQAEHRGVKIDKKPVAPSASIAPTAP